MPRHMRLDRRDLDFVIFANQVHRRICGQRAAASLANQRLVVDNRIGMVVQLAVMGIMPRLGTARTRVLALLFLVGRRRLRRCPRRLVRALQRQHQINQFVLAQKLQISAIHAPMDSEFSGLGKGVKKGWQNGVGNYPGRKTGLLNKGQL